MSSWIKMRTNLTSDPRVGALADECGVSEATVIGALFIVWSIADEHSADGQLSDFTLRTIDRRTGVPGFGAAMEKVGWLIAGERGAEIPRFEKHNSQSAKRRALEARRQAELRAQGAGDGAQDAQSGAPTEPEKPRSRQRKRGSTHGVRMKSVRAAYLEKERELEKEPNHPPTPQDETPAEDDVGPAGADEAAAVVFSFRAAQQDPDAGLAGEALAAARELAAMIGDSTLDRAAPFVARDGPVLVRELMAYTIAQRPRDPGAYVLHLLRTGARPTQAQTRSGTGKTAAEVAAEFAQRAKGQTA